MGSDNIISNEEFNKRFYELKDLIEENLNPSDSFDVRKYFQRYGPKATKKDNFANELSGFEDLGSDVQSEVIEKFNDLMNNYYSDTHSIKRRDARDTHHEPEYFPEPEITVINEHKVLGYKTKMLTDVVELLQLNGVRNSSSFLSTFIDSLKKGVDFQHLNRRVDTIINDLQENTYLNSETLNEVKQMLLEHIEKRDDYVEPKIEGRY